MEEKEIHINKGDMYFEECQYHEAISEYECAAELTVDAGELAMIYVKTGNCYRELCDYTENGLEDAFVYYELAYEKDSENEDVIRAMGRAYLHRKDDVACTYFEKLIALDKAEELDREMLFLCYNRLGRFPDADRVLESIAAPGWWCGKSYMGIRSYEKALKLFERALERMAAAEDYVPCELYFLIGNCFEHLKEWKKAEEIYLYGLPQYKTEHEQKQFYHALFLLYLRMYDFDKIRACLKKIQTGWIFLAVMEFEIDYVEAFYHRKSHNGSRDKKNYNKINPDKKKLAGINKKTKYLYEHDHNHMYPYALLAVGDLCRFYAKDFAQARQFYHMAVDCMGLYSLSVSAENLLIQIYLGHMEMAHQEKNLAETKRYALLLMEQVKKISPAGGEAEALSHFTQKDKNRDIIYRYYRCLEDKEKADYYYDSLYDTPFVISKYLME